MELLDAAGLNELNELSIIIRIVLSTFCGGILGLDRTRKRRAAGFRTYILVCLGAAVVMMTGQFMAEMYQDTDPTRMGAQVICGIGFLGAGTIMVTGIHQIKGLTTAAGLWACGCMGIAIGAGFYFGGLAMFLAIWLVMTVFELLQTKYLSKAKRVRLYAIFHEIKDMENFLCLAEKYDFCVHDFEIMRPDVGVGVVFTLYFKKRVSHAEVITMVKDCQGLTFIEEI